MDPDAPLALHRSLRAPRSTLTSYPHLTAESIQMCHPVLCHPETRVAAIGPFKAPIAATLVFSPEKSVSCCPRYKSQKLLQNLEASVSQIEIS